MIVTIPKHVAHSAELSARAQIPVLAQMALNVAVMVTRWQEVARTRKQLKDLPDYLYEDIGVTAQMVQDESSKPFFTSSRP